MKNKENEKEKILNNYKSPIYERRLSNSPAIIKNGQANDLGDFRIELKSIIKKNFILFRFS
jgi:hypothetical protein